MEDTLIFAFNSQSQPVYIRDETAVWQHGVVHSIKGHKCAVKLDNSQVRLLFSDLASFLQLDLYI